MMAKTHIAFGVLFATGGMAIGLIPTSLVHLPIYVAASAFGSLLPDLDHPHSAFGRRMRIISVPLSGIFGHRTITHSAIGMFILIAGMIALGDYINEHVGPTTAHHTLMVLKLVALGYLSHIAADALTVTGVPMLWPFNGRSRLGFVAVGGLLENIIRKITWGVVAYSTVVVVRQWLTVPVGVV